MERTLIGDTEEMAKTMEHQTGINNATDRGWKCSSMARSWVQSQPHKKEPTTKNAQA
jgi:hypothetical protein